MKKYKICENVTLGKNSVIEDFCVIGLSPKNQENSNSATIIGDNAYIRSHSVIYTGTIIGDNFNCGHHALIREGNIIGSSVSIGSFADIEDGVTIEDGVRIHSHVFVPRKTILKKNSWIGPNVVFTNSKYPRSKNSHLTLKGAVIKENARIGANVTILPGVTIGENCIIGAGSVVTTDIENNKIAVGNPAKITGNICDIEEYIQG